MTLSRRYVLGGLFVAAVAVTAALLVDVLATVFFAITVAYLLAPFRRELVARGVDSRLASVTVSVAAFVALVLVLAPLVVLTAARLTETLSLLSTLPGTVGFELFGNPLTIQVEGVRASVVQIVQRVGRQLLVSLPVLLVKFTLFVFLVYSLLQRSNSLAQSILAVIPPGYRSVVMALNNRTRATLYGIYIMQAATAVGTFLIALPVFFLLGYDAVFTLATVAAILQFIPIAGPSILLVVLAAVHLAAGEVVPALLVVGIGGLFVAWLPDILIRPRLAKRAANLPGSVYFVGFIGGLLSMGAIGIIAGPLLVALVLEAAELLAAELDGHSIEVS